MYIPCYSCCYTDNPTLSFTMSFCIDFGICRRETLMTSFCFRERSFTSRKTSCLMLQVSLLSA